MLINECWHYFTRQVEYTYIHTYIIEMLINESWSYVTRQAELGREIHAISSASKPLSTWLARDAAQECREACGGHGYFKGVSGSRFV